MAIDKKKYHESKQRKRASASDVASEMYDESNNDDELDELFARASANRNENIQKAVSDGILVQKQDGWYFKRFKINRVGLTFPADVRIEEYMDIGRFLLDISSRIQWLLGDWINHGDNYRWGETYSQIAEEFGYEVRTLHDYAYVARKIDFSIRIENLSFAHHQLVAGKDRQEQEQWLSRAEDKMWSVKQMREALKKPAQQLPEVQTPREKAVNVWRGLQTDIKNLEKGKLNDPAARDAAKSKIKSLRTYLDTLESQVDNAE